MNPPKVSGRVGDNPGKVQVHREGATGRQEQDSGTSVTSDFRPCHKVTWPSLVAVVAMSASRLQANRSTDNRSTFTRNCGRSLERSNDHLVGPGQLALAME